MPIVIALKFLKKIKRDEHLLNLGCFELLLLRQKGCFTTLKIDTECQKMFKNRNPKILRFF